MSNKSHQLTALRQRPGEGATIDVLKKEMPRPDGTTSTQFIMDLGSAPVPERRYVAEAANVEYKNESISIIFWQKKIKGDKARSMVVLKLPSMAALQFLQNSEEQVTHYEKSNKENKIEISMSLEDSPEEPDQTVCMATNIIMSSWSGREAGLDFYHASSFMMGAIPSGKFAAYPVVRITLPTGIFLAVWHKMNSFKHSFPEDELAQWRNLIS